jgi:predicted flap endonuclease-1-like 5' DNA nuclease
VTLFENVPALVCSQCGERVYDDHIVECIEEIIARRPPPKRVVSVEVHDLLSVPAERNVGLRRDAVRLADIKGIGPDLAEKLRSAGVRSVVGLLKAGGTAKGRRELAEKAGIAEPNILEWVKRADLFRIKGVGEEYSDLLEAAGVDTVVELSRRRAENLHAALVATNASKKLVRRVPPEKQVAGWIEQAKQLPQAVSH